MLWPLEGHEGGRKEEKLASFMIERGNGKEMGKELKAAHTCQHDDGLLAVGLVQALEGSAEEQVARHVAVLSMKHTCY